MADPQVLIVDADAAARELLGNQLAKAGARVSYARDARQALMRLELRPYLGMFLDMAMPDFDGIAALGEALETRPELAVVVMASRPTVQLSTEVLRKGACDLLTKPLAADAVEAAFRRMLIYGQSRGRAIGLVERGAISKGGPSMAEPPDTDSLDEPLVDGSAAMREVSRLVARFAPSSAPVFLHGERGVGKRYVARALHRQGQLTGRFIHFPCAALPATEIDWWLFGHPFDPRGRDRPVSQGLLRQAAGGTLFLDNVDRLPPCTQARLCDALQRGCFHASPGQPPVALNVRLIAASVLSQSTAVAHRRFHRGLGRHFSVAAIKVPPLSDRKTDLPTLIERALIHAVAIEHLATDREPRYFSASAMNRLLQHSWPGNLTELRTVVAHAVATAPGREIGPESVEFVTFETLGDMGDAILLPLAGSLREIERRVIDAVLARCHGNKAAAARRLGLHRRTLYRLLDGVITAPEASESEAAEEDATAGETEAVNTRSDSVSPTHFPGSHAVPTYLDAAHAAIPQ